MGKILVFALIATAAVAIASRNVRSPGGSGWQASNGYGGALSSGYARSSGGGWGGSGSGLARSASDGGWRDPVSFGSSARSQTRSANAYGNRNGYGILSSSGWSQPGYGFSDAYSGDSVRSSSGWGGRFTDSDVVESINSSNGWDEPDVGFRSNGWQSEW